MAYIFNYPAEKIKKQHKFFNLHSFPYPLPGKV